MNKLLSVIGVDLGGTRLKAGRIADRELVANRSVPTPEQPKNLLEVLDILKDLIASVFDDTVEAIGIGVPGLVDSARGIAFDVENIPFWKEVPLKAILEETFSVPVHVDNDANCFALGEHLFGCAQSVENFVGLTLGTGVGGGIIQRGRLLASANCGAGEFGVLPYRDKTLEYYCSGSFFKNVCGVEGEILFKRAEENDREALAAFREYGKHLAEAVKIVVLTIDPELIVFGGSAAAAHSLFEASMREYFNDFVYQKSIQNLQIRFSTMDHPGIRGAASLCY